MARPERHDADYFPFFVKDGKTLYILESKYGLEGIGFFTNLMRFLTRQTDHHICIKEESDRMYFFAQIRCPEDIGIDMLNLMAKTGKIDADLWGKSKVVVSADLLNSLRDAYKNRKNAPIEMAQIRVTYRQNEISSPDNPITYPDNTQTKLKETKLKERVKVRKQKATTLPPDFSISESVKKWAAEKGFKRLDEHLEAFKAKCMAKGYEYIDWDSAFREAIRTDWAKLNTGGNGNGRHGEGGYGIQPTGRAMPKEYRGEDIPIPDEQTRKDNVERARALTRSLASHNIPSGNT